MPTTRSTSPRPITAPREEMVAIPGGTFLMGSNDFYPEERPVHRVAVDAFRMDAHPVTNAEFARFVEATGYVTVAERAPDPVHYPGVDPSLLVPGSLVFRRPRRRVPLHDPRAWWAYVPGACWRHPEGPGSTIEGREEHPVVHVAWEDAAAYAEWTGKALPTEAEWEFAARGGLEGAVYVWGDEFMPHGQPMANTWQGEFPWQSLKPRGRYGTTPVGSFPPNSYGLFDMAGNVWEWTSDLFTPRHPADTDKACCTPGDPKTRSPAAIAPGAESPPPAEAGARRSAPDPVNHPVNPSVSAAPDAHIPRRVVKGGSHLCAPNYCLRYRPAARQGEAIDTSTSHIGFRCVAR